MRYVCICIHSIWWQVIWQALYRFDRHTTFIWRSSRNSTKENKFVSTFTLSQGILSGRIFEINMLSGTRRFISTAVKQYFLVLWTELNSQISFALLLLLSFCYVTNSVVLNKTHNLGLVFTYKVNIDWSFSPIIHCSWKMFVDSKHPQLCTAMIYSYIATPLKIIQI